MKERTDLKSVTRGLLTSLLAACFAVSACPAFSGEDQPVPTGQAQTATGTSAPQPSAEKPAAVPAGASGMTVHIDPKTGAFLEEPVPGQTPLLLSPQLQNTFSTSHEGLVEMPSSEPGGGVKLDLQGRFQSPLIGTINADGKVKIQHPDERPGSHDKK